MSAASTSDARAPVRAYFKDEWHCGQPPLDCWCWTTWDVERDKEFLQTLFEDHYQYVEVDYAQYVDNYPQKNTTHREFTVSISGDRTGKERASVIKAEPIFEAMYHGFFMTNVWASYDYLKIYGIVVTTQEPIPIQNIDFERTNIRPKNPTPKRQRYLT